MPKALLVVQAFPPLLKNAGGVAKRYLTLCRALIDGLGWSVTLLTPVDVTVSGEPDVDRWLAQGSLTHLPARGVRLQSVDGVLVILDLFSFINTGHILKTLFVQGGFDAVFADDVPWRGVLLLLARAAGVPTIVTSHTDATHLKSYKQASSLRMVWWIHMWSAYLATTHASVSKVFGDQMAKSYHVPVNGIWPPILWSKDFRAPPEEFADRAAAQRAAWLAALAEQGFVGTPRAILLFAGRWSPEKRIHLLLDAVPDGCALVIVGDGTAEYAVSIAAAGPSAGRVQVLPQRKMLNACELRTAYAAADVFLSASNFETLGNTVIESWCAGTPVAVQPAQGHLEFVQDGINSWFVDYDLPPAEVKAALDAVVRAGKDSLTGLEATGTKLRTSNFARNFDEAIISPALVRHSSWFATNKFLQLPLRAMSFIVWLYVWIFLRIFNRSFYMISSNPKFEVLEKLGGCMETRRKSETTPPPVPPHLTSPPATERTSVEGPTGFNEMFRNVKVARKSFGVVRP